MVQRKNYATAHKNLLELISFPLVLIIPPHYALLCTCVFIAFNYMSLCFDCFHSIKFIHTFSLLVNGGHVGVFLQLLFFFSLQHFIANSTTLWLKSYLSHYSPSNMRIHLTPSTGSLLCEHTRGRSQLSLSYMQLLPVIR